ncbi:MAG: LysR family transcriptional regulator [Rhodospirillaceae bacterium]|nr:LysR family transcriptional regulator [Rhodospirillaceae bacterium]
MKDSLKAGVQASRQITVDKERTIDFMGDALRVYATPKLVHDIEHSCRDLLLEHLDPGEDSVGTRVEIDHMGATLLNMTVTLSTTIKSVEGRLVTFEVTAEDDIEQVATCTHVRFVVEMSKLEQRLKAKAEKI